MAIREGQELRRIPRRPQPGDQDYDEYSTVDMIGNWLTGGLWSVGRGLWDRYIAGTESDLGTAIGKRFDILGQHDETSVFKSDAENKAIADAMFEQDWGGAEGPYGTDYRNMLNTIMGTIEKHQDAVDEERERSRRDYEEFTKARRKLAKDEEGRITQDRGFWDRMRDTALENWQKERTGMLDFWGGVRDEQAELLRSIQGQQLGLVQELREAPSTVAEQARIEHDRMLQESVAMAGAMGGGVSSNYKALSDMSRMRRGEVMMKTAGLRSAEYADRINQQAGILAGAGGISGMITGLGETDVGLRSGLAQQDYNLRTGLGRENVNVGTALQGRRQSLLGSIIAGSTMGRAGSADYLSGLRALPAMAMNLQQQRMIPYQAKLANRELQERKLLEHQQRMVSFGATGAQIIGDVAFPGAGTAAKKAVDAGTGGKLTNQPISGTGSALQMLPAPSAGYTPFSRARSTA